MNRDYALFLGLSIELAGLIVVFLFVGREIDNKLGWGGIGIALSVAFAMAIWIYHISRAMKKWNKENEEPPNK